MSFHQPTHDAPGGIPLRHSAPVTPEPTPRRVGAGRRRAVGLLAGLALALGGLTGLTAASTPLATAAPATTSLTGILVVIADGPTGESPYRLATEDGRLVPLADPTGSLAGVPRGSTITIDVAAPAGADKNPADAAAPGKASPADAAAPSARVTVASAQIVAPAPPAPSPGSLQPAPHTLDVVMLSANGQDRFASDSDVRRIVDDATAFWARESRGVVTSVNLGAVGTASYSPANQPSPCSGDALDPMMNSAAAALGVPTSQYVSGNGVAATRRHLLVLTTEAFIAQWPGKCDFGGRGIYGNDLASGGPIWGTFIANDPVWTSAAVIHELGHNMGLGHAAATPPSCVATLWDGPFDANDPPVNQAACPLAKSTYADWHNIMGAGTDEVLSFPQPALSDVIISGRAKAILGLITPGAGVVSASPTPTDQTITIQQTQTQDRSAPQSILLSESVPGCGTQMHTIDYDPYVGGVRVFRVADTGDCQTKTLFGDIWADTVVLTTDAATGRQYLPVGQPRQTQSGQTEITVVSTTATTATIRLHQVGTPPPPVSTLTVSPTELLLPAAGGKGTVTVTTTQGHFGYSLNYPGFDYSIKQSPGGGTITISAGANNTGVERSATFPITDGTTTVNLRVVQPPVGSGGSTSSTLKLSRTTWNPGKGARSVKVTVTSNQDVQVTQIPSWASLGTCKLKKNGQTQTQTKTCRLSVQKNTGPARTGVVRFATTANGQTVTADLVITQKGAQRG